MKIYHMLGVAPYYTNCFLLSDEKDSAVLIDCSVPTDKIKEALKNEGVELKAVLLTHGHHDHIECIKETKEEFNVPVYLAKEDAAHFDLKDTTDYKNDSFNFGKIDFNILRTPGHTPGSICIIAENYMFSGDTLFSGTVGRTDFPGGNYEEMLSSLKEIIERVDENCNVLPGHNHFSTLKIEKEQNPYLKNIIREM